MTGFGRTEFDTSAGSVQIEIKTVNHRYFEFSPKLPFVLMSYEEQIRRLVQSKIKRGKIYFTVNAPEVLVRKGKIHVDHDLALEYLKALKKLNAILNLKEKITLNHIIRLPDVLNRTSSVSDRDIIWKKLKRAIEVALTDLDRSRREEGKALVEDMKKRCHEIAASYDRIKKRVPAVAELFRKKAEKRVQQGDTNLDQLKGKIEAEVANFAKNTDITEEIVRLANHIQTFLKTLSQGGQVGKKIDFIAQEMMREANTMGAKCNDSVISSYVIEIKSQLEKIREQALNLE